MHREKQIQKFNTTFLTQFAKINMVPRNTDSNTQHVWFFHEILKAAIKDNFDETHICIFQNSSFNSFLSGLSYSCKNKKEVYLGRRVSRIWFWILSLWIGNESWLNVSHAPAMADNKSLQLIALNKSWVLERSFVNWAFYNL